MCRLTCLLLGDFLQGVALLFAVFCPDASHDHASGLSRSHGSPQTEHLAPSASAASRTQHADTAAALAAAASGGSGPATSAAGNQGDPAPSDVAAAMAGHGPVVAERLPEAAAAAAAVGVEAVGNVLSSEWVDAVVQEMMSAKNLDDAREKAGRVLQSFGTAAVERACKMKVM